MRLMITGATGFVGQAVTQAACHRGYNVTALVRKESELLPARVAQFAVGDFTAIAEHSGYSDLAIPKNINSPPIEPELNSKLLSAMQGVDVVIHTAARAHVMHEHLRDPEAQYHLINVALTERLAEVAAEAGVKRFVFISSIKVNGERTLSEPFTENDLPAPEDHYGRSKWAAEQALMAISKRTGMDIVILRPPLIYGPGVKGNFVSLIKLVDKGIPLPFRATKNQRSLLALDNLVSAVLLTATHSDATNQTFLVADDEVVSTADLLKAIAVAQGKESRQFYIPVSWMKLAASIIGKASVADRLFGSLRVDSTKIRKKLGWRPVISMQQQLKKMQPNQSDVDTSGY